MNARCQGNALARWSLIVLCLGAITTGGRALAQAPSARANSVEHAAALVRAKAFTQAAAMLREVLAADPTNREAKELLAFDLESMGDLEGERRVRAELAAEYPNDPHLQADYGRVLERAGEEEQALRAYRRARELNGGRPQPDVDAAIVRMKGRTAVEVGAPLTFLSAPDGQALRLQAGAAVPLGSRRHLAVLGTRSIAEASTGPAATASDALALTFVQRSAGGASWAVGPRLHRVDPRDQDRRDLGLGGAIEGRARLGPQIEGEGRVEAETPWDEAAVTMLNGGRTSLAEAHLYLHGNSRLLFQAGARRRRLSILAPEGSQSNGRPTAWQSLWLAGADVVAWRKSGTALPGEMLNEAMIAPTTISSALTLAYRHYDVTSRTTPEFAAAVGLVPRAAVDEVSATTTLAPASRLGLEFSAGLARDSARPVRSWRAGGSLICALTPASRFVLGYEGATEVASGLTGRRRMGWVSFHVDL